MNKKLSGSSENITEDQKAKLKEFFPEVFAEDKIDWEKLKSTLGKEVDLGEGYSLSWKGKSNVFRTIQEPTTKTLKPARDESVNFDETENLFIEGDNLEALKILQRSYYGKIKMIYIDPPYNTGNDFVYNDKFAQSKAEYEEEAGIRDEEGKVIRTDGLKPNRKDSGHFHSNWLNMMYPRLYLARNLLEQDGVMFVSIDDNEAHNLRMIMDEIFGEQNLLSIHHIQVRYGNKSLNERKDFQELIEYVFIYAKDKSQLKLNKPKIEYPIDKFNLEIEHNEKPSKTVEENGRKVDIWDRDSFKIKKVKPGVKNFKSTWISGSILTGTGHGKMYTKVVDKRRSEDGDGCLYRIHGIGEDGLGYRYYTNPKNKNANRGTMYTKVPTNILDKLKTGTADKENPIINFYDFSPDFGNIRHEGDIPFNGGKKPVKMLKQFLNYMGGKDFIVLDFFAGSASTAHAAMQLNVEDGGNRKFIMVQLGEDIDEKEDKVLYDIAKNLNQPTTIASIGKERIRRSAKKIKNENKETKFDGGFKALKVEDTNFKVWDPDITDADKLKEQMKLHLDSVNKDVKEEDLLMELMLKVGIEPTAEKDKRKGYWIVDKSLAICLADKLDEELFQIILSDKPSKIILLDSAFSNNDQLKANLLLQAEINNIEILVV